MDTRIIRRDYELNRMRYDWELRGLLNDWLTIEREITLDGISLEPSKKDSIECIRFKVPLSTTDKSRSEAMKRCLNKLESLIKIWSFHGGTPVNISEKELILTNEQALEKKQIVREKSINLKMQATVKKIVKDDELKDVMHLKKRISQNVRRNELKKCVNWCVNSIEQEDPFDKFIALWVGFNIIYNLYDAYRNPDHRDEYNDHRKAIQIKRIVNGRELIKIIETRFNIIEFLKQYNISHRKRNDSIVQYNFELERFYKNDELARAFEMFLECLYKIRCNLLHGEKERESYRQRRLLQECNSALPLVVKDALD